MIENSTRHYIVIYKDTIDIISPIEYLVVENFGNTSGIITDMVYDKEQLKALFNKSAIDLDLLKYFSTITITTKDVELKYFTFKIEYKSSTNVTKKQELVIRL